MTTQYMQNAPGNLEVVVGNVDQKAVEVFFRDNRLVQYLIRRHAGERLSEEVYGRHCQVIWRRLRLCVLRISGGHLAGIILP